MTISRPVSRFTMKRVIAPIGVTATVLASLAIGLPAAQAAAGTDPVIGSWSWSAFTDPQADPSPPDDPDGQSGEGNFANVSQIGERYEKEAPGTESTEKSGWRRTAPDGQGWEKMPGADGEKRVVDKAAWDETIVDEAAWTDTVVDEAAHWQRYSWTGGPHRSDDPPASPSDDGNWQPNVAGDPHGVGVEGAYYRSNGNSGDGDWFYLEAVPAT